MGARSELRAARRDSRVRLALWLAVAVVPIDQFTKALLQDILLRAGHIEVVPNYFDLVMVWNRGVSFGMLGGSQALPPWVLSMVALAICVGLYVWLRRAETLMSSLAIGLVIGGAIGNVIDRARWGAVFDFADFHVGRWHWPAFNVADAAIVIGVVVLLAESLFSGTARRRPGEMPAEAGPGQRSDEVRK